MMYNAVQYLIYIFNAAQLISLGGIDSVYKISTTISFLRRGSVGESYSIRKDVRL